MVCGACKNTGVPTYTACTEGSARASRRVGQTRTPYGAAFAGSRVTRPYRWLRGSVWIAGMTRRVAMSPIPMTIQLSMRGGCRQKNKGRPGPAFEIHFKQRLLLGCDRVLRGLGDAELHDGLSLDLDGFAGLRVASHASLAVRLHQTAQ